MREGGSADKMHDTQMELLHSKIPSVRHIADAGERRSKRARRGEAEVKVSSGNTLWDFKLRLVEALSIHPKNADVHIRIGGAWQKLTNDEASLAGEGHLLATPMSSNRPAYVSGNCPVNNVDPQDLLQV